MQLDIRSGEEETRLAVTLKDGYIPVVGNHIDAAAPDLDSRALQIEPAIWFKVLALDSVVIDCPKRAIMWNSDPNTALGSELRRCPGKSGRASNEGEDEEESPLQKRKRISQSMYIGGEFYGFESELDELFDTMQEKLKAFSDTNIDAEEFYETVMRMLHCHVLPAITLTEEDSARLEYIHGEQEHLIEMVDDEVMQKERQAEEIKEAAKRQRQKYIEELAKNDLPAAEDYLGDFAVQLKHDIEQDIEVSSDRLNELQRAVEKAKVRAMCETNTHHSQEVDFRRQERDAGFAEHQTLLHARENLRELVKETAGERRRSLTESIRDSFRSKKTREIVKPLRNIYLEMHRKIRSIKGDIMKLVEKKVMMISVKEAIRNTLKEIGETNESQGFDADRRGGSRATHVLRQSRIPREWLTLTEQVAVILADASCEITQAHLSFTDSVISRCSAALFEKHLLNLSSSSDEDSCDAGAMHDSLPKHDSDPCKGKEDLEQVHSLDNHLALEGEIGLDDVVIIHNTNEDHLKQLAENLKSEIHAHFEMIVKKFQEELNILSRTAPKKLWLCYEAHFYDTVMENLMKVYEYAYSHISNKLCQCIPELDAEDLNLEDTVVVRVLETSRHRSQLRVQFSDDSSAFCEPENQDQVDPNQNAEDETQEPVEQQQMVRAHSNVEDKSDDLRAIEEKEELLRQLSVPTPETPTDARVGHQVKKVKIHYPSSVTMIYNRRTWPMPHVQSVAGEFECGMDALMLDSDESLSADLNLEEIAEIQSAERLGSNTTDTEEPPPPSPSRKMKIRGKYRHLFTPALTCIRDAINDTVPLVKLQHLTRCLREIAEGITNLQTEESLKPMGVCVDNLLDMLVILLCNCNAQTVARLHAHVMMLTDLMPPCLMNGPYEYSILQFFGAFQIIQERVVVKSRSQGAGENL